MDFITITNEEFMNSNVYKDFMNRNTGRGNLKIRAYAASEALPVSGLKITVSTMIDNKKVVFFDGETDASGMIQTLSLPTPKLNLDNLDEPLTIVYVVSATSSDKSSREFLVNMYEGVCVVQNINFIPGGNYGS